MQNNVVASDVISNNVGGAGAGASNGNEGNDNNLPEGLGGGQGSSGANSSIGNPTGLLAAPGSAPMTNHNQQHQQSRPTISPANQQHQHHQLHHQSGGHPHGGHMQHHQHHQHPQIASGMHHHPYVTPAQQDNSGYQHHPHHQQQRSGGGAGGGGHHISQSYHHNQQQPQHQMQHYHHQPPSHHHSKQKYDGHQRRNHSDNESNLNHVLLITVINPHYPINCSLIHQICSPYGKVNRIVIFKKNGVQAMVEFDNLESAKRAKSMLYGCDIYSGCCTLKIEYAKPARLNIHKNDDDSFDYTNPNPGNSTNSSAQEDTASIVADANNSSNSTGLVVAATSNTVQSTQPTQNQTRSSISPGSQQLPQHQASSGHPISGQMQIHHHQMSSNMHHPYVNPSQPDNSGYQHHHQQQRGHHVVQNYHHNQQQQPQQQMHHSTVMMVYGLLTERVNCDRLFNLFCLYGNVVRVKFLKTKEGCAMVQMGDILAVDRCISSLHKMTLFDNELQISYSKQAFLHDVISPFILPDGSPSFKDFMGNKNNRFKNPEVASKNRILPPSPVLHFFNAPYGITEDEIVHLFKFTAGHEPISIKIFTPKVENIKSYSGLITFKDPAEAAEALVMCNHLTMPKPGASNPYILRLCFSPPSYVKTTT